MVLLNRAEWQRAYLRRLDAGEKVARRLGLGRDEIRAAFGDLWIPGAIGRLPPNADRELYDVAGLLDLPPRGRDGSGDRPLGPGPLPRSGQGTATRVDRTERTLAARGPVDHSRGAIG